MAQTLVSFLGRTPKSSKGYSKLKYSLDGETGNPFSYSGYFLKNKFSPARLVILGTSGSMWDHLFEIDVDLGSQEEDLRLALCAAVEQQQVTQPMLDELTPLLASALGCELVLRVIPNGRSQAEQVEIISRISEALGEDDRVSLDITHGYRHLPLLASMAVIYVNVIKPRIRFEHVWYGEYNADEGTAIMTDVGGVLALNSWVDAIRRNEYTGDFGAIADIIGDVDITNDLKEASFQESIHRGSKARAPLKRVRTHLQANPLPGLGAMFQPVLEQRTGWVHDEKSFMRQRSQAMAALARGDTLRATLFGFEAYITRKMQESGNVSPGDIDKHRVRADFQDPGNRQIEFTSAEEKQQYIFLRNIRNALAHGDQLQTKEIQAATNNQTTFTAELTKLLENLLN